MKIVSDNQKLRKALAEMCYVLVEFHGDDGAKEVAERLLGKKWMSLVDKREPTNE